MAKSLENFLSKIIKYGLYAILITPLALWPKALYPFLTSKFILFQILVEIVFAAWLILLIKRGFTRTWADLRGNYIILSLAGFFAVSFISAIFGVDFQRSFWGFGPRLTGLFGELHFMAWFLVLTSSLYNPNKSKNPNNPNSEYPGKLVNSDYYLNFSFFVAIAVGLTSFYENPQWGLVYGYDIFNNQTFAAPYYLFHFFWGLYQIINKLQTTNYKLQTLRRWIFGAGTIFILYRIFITQIRGAIIGLLAGLFILGVGLLFGRALNKKTRVAVGIIGGLILLALSVFIVFRNNPVFQELSPIKKITGISLSETTVQTRISTWRVALKGFGKDAFFGVGPENFNYLFNANYDPQSLKFGGGGFHETWFDKPHNAFLEVLTETGVIGMLAYILIWIAAVIALRRLYKAGDKILSLILAAAFISYFGSMFFAFDSFGSWFGLYLTLCFLASQINPNNMERNPNDPNSDYSDKIRKFGLLIIPIFVFGLLYLNYSIWRANLYDAESIRMFSRDTGSGMTLAKRSLDYWTPYAAEYKFDLFTAVASAIQKNQPLPDPETTINFVLEKADEVVAAHPNDAAYLTGMAKLFGILAERGRDPQILAWARDYGEKSLLLSPSRQETLFYLSKIALLQGDTNSAVARAKEALDAAPSIYLSRWYYGLALLADGRAVEGKTEIKEALDLGYKPKGGEIELIKNLGLQ